MSELALPPQFPQRLVFLGTPAMAVPPLQALVDSGFSVELVISRPDKRRGRGSQILPAPVKEKAQELQLPVSDDLSDLNSVNCDLAVVVAYGRIIPTSLLEKVPMVNLHFSLLPRWRGAAPVERAILAGDSTTGVCLMAIEPTLDTGAVYAQVETPIGEYETAEQLRKRLSDLGAQLLIENLRSGLTHPREQLGEATYAEKLSASDFRIDWSASAQHISRQIRIGNAATNWRGKNFKIHDAKIVAPASEVSAQPSTSGAAGTIFVESGSGEVMVQCGDGWLALQTVQPEGKPARPASEWKNGAQLRGGERFE